MSTNLANQQQLQQQQLLLRLPESLAIQVRHLVRDDGKQNPLAPPPTVNVKAFDEANPSNDFIFTLSEIDYPALLMNLPTPVETHKTFDKKTFLKSADIGQVLQVFLTHQEKEKARAGLCKSLYGEYAPSGITPPAQDIVKRRFELSRKTESRFAPYLIRDVIDEINNGYSVWVRPKIDAQNNSISNRKDGDNGEDNAQNDTSATASQGVGSNSNNNNTTKKSTVPLNENKVPILISRDTTDMGDLNADCREVIETIEEQVVDFEDWMVDYTHQNGRSITVQQSCDGSNIEIFFNAEEYTDDGKPLLSCGSGSNSSVKAHQQRQLNEQQQKKEAAGLLFLAQHPDIFVSDANKEEDELLDQQQRAKRKHQTPAAATVTASTTAAPTEVVAVMMSTASSGAGPAVETVEKVEIQVDAAGAGDATKDSNLHTLANSDCDAATVTSAASTTGKPNGGGGNPASVNCEAEEEDDEEEKKAQEEENDAGVVNDEDLDDGEDERYDEDDDQQEVGVGESAHRETAIAAAVTEFDIDVGDEDEDEDEDEEAEAEEEDQHEENEEQDASATNTTGVLATSIRRGIGVGSSSSSSSSSSDVMGDDDAELSIVPSAEEEQELAESNRRMQAALASSGYGMDGDDDEDDDGAGDMVPEDEDEDEDDAWMNEVGEDDEE